MDRTIDVQKLKHSGVMLDDDVSKRMKKKERKRVEQWTSVVFYGNLDEIPSVNVMDKQLSRTMDLAKVRDFSEISAMERGCRDDVTHGQTRLYLPR